MQLMKTPECLTRAAGAGGGCWRVVGGGLLRWGDRSSFPGAALHKSLHQNANTDTLLMEAAEPRLIHLSWVMLAWGRPKPSPTDTAKALQTIPDFLVPPPDRKEEEEEEKKRTAVSAGVSNSPLRANIDIHCWLDTARSLGAPWIIIPASRRQRRCRERRQKRGCRVGVLARLGRRPNRPPFPSVFSATQDPSPTR